MTKKFEEGTMPSSFFVCKHIIVLMHVATAGAHFFAQ